MVRGSSVEGSTDIQVALKDRLTALHAVADKCYVVRDNWLSIPSTGCYLGFAWRGRTSLENSKGLWVTFEHD